MEKSIWSFSFIRKCSIRRDAISKNLIMTN